MTDKELDNILQSAENDHLSHTFIDGVLKLLIDSDISDLPNIIWKKVRPKIRDFIFYDILGSVVYGRSGPPRVGSSAKKTSVSFDNPSYADPKYDSYFEANVDNAYNNGVAMSSKDFDFNKVIFKTKEEAVAAKRKLEDIIMDKGYATLTEYCRIVNKRPEFTYNSVGWTSMEDARIATDDRGKWRLFLPRIRKIY